MSMMPPFNLMKWIEDNADKLQPPVANHQFYKEQWENFVIMIVGENARPDYHDDPGEEFFYQIKGDLTLRLIDPLTRKREDVIVKEGEMFLLPAHTRHSPQRPANSVGLVIERYRQPGEIDALEWYDEDGFIEFRGEFTITDIEKDLGDVIETWKKWSQDPERTIPTTYRAGRLAE